MTTVRRFLAAVAATTLLAGPALAGDVTAMERRVAKYAAELAADFSYKGLCVCQNGGENHGRAGYLRYTAVSDGTSQKVATVCEVHTYDLSGNDTIDIVNCIEFVPLAK